MAEGCRTVTGAREVVSALRQCTVQVHRTSCMQSYTLHPLYSRCSGFASLAVAPLVAIYISRALLVTVVEHAGGWSQVRSVLGTARSHITLALRESPRDTAHPVLRGRLFNN